MYNTEPTPKYVHDFVRRMEQTWDEQKKHDDLAFELYSKEHPIDVAEPESDAKKTPIRTLKTGLPGRIVDQDAAILSQPPGFRVNPPPSRQGRNKLERHASGVLEPWLTSAFEQSQFEEVWLQQVRDLRLFGRGWSNVFVLPRLWAQNDYTELVDSLSAALESGDEDRIDLAREAIEDYKRENFPIRWQHADARSTWHQVSTERRLPEVVEVKEIPAAEVAADYGPDVLPKDVDPDSDNKVRLFVYTNWYWTAAVVEHSKELAHKWKHDLGMNPYILLESTPQPSGRRVRWKSALYDHADIFEALDEILSDLRHNHRRNTLMGHVFSLDPDVYSQGGNPDTAATPQQILDYEPGSDLVLWNKSGSVSLMPAPIINPQSMQLLEFTDNFAQSVALNPVEFGRMMSNVSAVGYTTALQAAQRRLDPISRGIVKACRDWAKLVFLNVKRLSAEFPDTPDKVYVIQAGGQAIGVSPSDVEGWHGLVQPRLSQFLQINENAMMALAHGAFQLGIPPDFIYEHYLNIENPEDLLDRAERWKIREALLEDKIMQAKVLAGQLSQQFPQEQAADLAARISNLPVAVQMGIRASGVTGGGPLEPPGQPPRPPGTRPGSPGAERQALSNVRRTATPQDLSNTVAETIVPGAR